MIDLADLLRGETEAATQTVARLRRMAANVGAFAVAAPRRRCCFHR